MEFTYPEELLLNGINQYLLYGRRNAFSYSADATLDDGTETKFSNYIFPRNSHATVLCWMCLVSICRSPALD